MCSLFSSKYAIALALVGHEAALVALLPLALQVHRHIGGDDGLDVVGLRQGFEHARHALRELSLEQGLERLMDLAPQPV